MQQKNRSDKQIKKFNVQNNKLHKQVALHHIVFIRSLHHNGSNNWLPSRQLTFVLTLLVGESNFRLFQQNNFLNWALKYSFILSTSSFTS